MRIALYLLIAGIFPLMAWTCAKQPYRALVLPARVLHINAPDTVAQRVPFQVKIDARIADCEILLWEVNSNRYSEDTTYFKVLAERDKNGAPCDTTRPSVQTIVTHTFKAPGKQYFVFEARNGDWVDSVYVK